MNIYLFNMLLTIFWGSILLNKRNPQKKIFIGIVSLQMILISALRDISIGADTWNYENHFRELIELDMYSWKNLFLRFFQFGNYNSRDVGSELVTKLFATLIPNFRIYLFAVAIFVCWGLGRFLYKYSENLCLSYVIFQSFLFHFFLLTGIRQTIAVSLVVFWGYDLILDKKPVKFLLLCLVAMTFHSTAIIMLPFYFVCNYKFGQIHNSNWGVCGIYVIWLQNFPIHTVRNVFQLCHFPGNRIVYVYTLNAVNCDSNGTS